MRLEGDPIANLVANTLRLLANEAERILELDEECTGETRVRVERVRARLDEWADATSIASPGVLRERLTPLLTSGDAPEGAGATQLWRDLVRLHRDLSYLARIATGGLAAINELTGGLLAKLNEPGLGSSESVNVTAQLNDLLRRAIYLFPHLATEVTLLVEPAEPEFMSRVGVYVGKHRAHREELSQLWQASGAPREDDHWVMRLPLPYAFSAESPAARRDAQRESWEDLVFLPRRWIRRHDVVGTIKKTSQMQAEQPPLTLVRTALDLELLQSHEAMLLAREVRGISFGTRPDLLRAFNTRSEDRQAHTRPDGLTHYLRFRDFGDIGRNKQFAQVLGVPALAERSLFEPGYSSDLLDAGDDEISRQWLERGFGYLALLGHGNPEPTLLRFQNVEIEYDEQSVKTAKHSPLQVALYRAALDEGDALRAHATEFRGAAIVRELMQVPVAPRRFRAG